MAGVGQQRHRIGKETVQRLDDDKAGVQGDTDGERAAKARRCVDVTVMAVTVMAVIVMAMTGVGMMVLVRLGHGAMVPGAVHVINI